MTEKAQGPQSYFPSIEAKYGKSIDYWLKQLEKHKTASHMEQVAFLKTEHEMGHGHANALVAYFRSSKVK